MRNNIKNMISVLNDVLSLKTVEDVEDLKCSLKNPSFGSVHSSFKKILFLIQLICFSHLFIIL